MVIRAADACLSGPAMLCGSATDLVAREDRRGVCGLDGLPALNDIFDQPHPRLSQPFVHFGIALPDRRRELVALDRS